MISEVEAMANGDPVNLGYLMGSNYTRGFPGPVKHPPQKRHAPGLPLHPGAVLLPILDPVAPHRFFRHAQLPPGQLDDFIHTHFFILPVPANGSAPGSLEIGSFSAGPPRGP